VTTLDANFNGRIDAALPGSEDWSALRLDQIGARRNVGALYQVPGTTQFAVGPLSLDSGKGDLGKGDLGKGDLGKGDLGKGDLGKGDLGKGDLGKGDLGKGDLGKGDLGGGDLFDGDPNNPGGELDATIASGLARTPPNQFTACVIGETCQGPAARQHQVQITWTPPTVGDVASYTVYRVASGTPQPGQTWTTVTTTPATLGQTSYAFVDGTPLVNGAPYTYFAAATYNDGVASDPSNLVTITGFNDAPTVTGLTDVAIDANGTTGPLPFTIADTEGLSGLTVTGTSSNPTLVPNANIVFAGTGANRTVTVTPAANQTGSATITVRVTDVGGVSGTAAFVLTVRPVAPITFVGVKNIPPDDKPIRAGSTIPLAWRYQRGATVVNSSGARFEVTAVGPSQTFINTDAGNSGFRYDDGTWRFNLQTRGPNGKPYPEGIYTVTVKSLTAGFPSSAPFTINVTK
jgi:hypothetical protein